MSFNQHAQMETGGDNRYTGFISLGTERRSHQTVMVFNGPDGLETVLRFTEITIGRNSIAFYTEHPGRHKRRQKVGMIEASSEVVGFLRAATREHEELDYDVVDDR